MLSITLLARPLRDFFVRRNILKSRYFYSVERFAGTIQWCCRGLAIPGIPAIPGERSKNTLCLDIFLEYRQ